MTATVETTRDVVVATKSPIPPGDNGQLFMTADRDGDLTGVTLNGKASIDSVRVGKNRFSIESIVWPVRVKAGQIVTLVAQNDADADAVLEGALTFANEGEAPIKEVTGEVEPALAMPPSPVDAAIERAAKAAEGARRAIVTRPTSENLAPKIMKSSKANNDAQVSIRKTSLAASSFPTSEVVSRAAPRDPSAEVLIAPGEGEVAVDVIRAHAETLLRHLRDGHYMDATTRTTLAYRFALGGSTAAIAASANEIVLVLAAPVAEALSEVLSQRVYALEDETKASAVRELEHVLAPPREKKTTKALTREARA